jgi:flagellar hook-length control protein FliK
MNVTHLNTAAKLSGNKAIENSKRAFPENWDNSTDFANTLKGQEKLLNETKNKYEKPVPPQQHVDKQSNTSDVKPNGNDDHQELAALLEKYLPPATAQNENVTATIEPAILPASTDSPTAATPPADVTVAQDMSGAMALTGMASAKPIPEEARPGIAGDQSASEGAPLQKATFISQSPQASQEPNHPSSDITETFKQTLDSLPESGQKTPEITTASPSPVQKPIETRIDSPVITKPLTHPGWGKDLGEHIIWMNNKEISAAEIKLNPVHLGPISVRIDVDQNNQTSILFTAQHTETKEALETSLPKLREMLQGQQLNLVNVNISQNSSSNHGRSPSQAFANAPGSQDQPGLEAAPTLNSGDNDQLVNNGLLSLYV